MASLSSNAEESGPPQKMSSDVQTRLMDAERFFRRACEQIVQLNRRLDEMAKRYDKASRENHRSFRYSLRLRMAVTEGVRNMYYEYAANKADEITNLRCQALHDSEMGSSEEDNSDFDPMDDDEYEATDEMEGEAEPSSRDEPLNCPLDQNGE
ncbi:hypothetical protein SNE40_012698 [Patella caerulea]|uniref:Uncharacterized protein n=1 Tax=Patella caerulea TaxID=87958 RepID=A0AAN8PNP9_PATCE